MDTTKLKEGQYYYQRHRNMWGVWRKGNDEGLTDGDVFISDFSTQAQAKSFVYKANNWLKE